MSDKHEDKHLARLAALTEDLRPDEALDDAVTLLTLAEATVDLDATADLTSGVMDAIEIEALAQRTASLEPGDTFVDAVMGQVKAQAPASSGAWPALWRSGRAALVAAAAVAAGFVAYAGYVQSAFDSEVLANVDSIEVDE